MKTINFYKYEYNDSALDTVYFFSIGASNEKLCNAICDYIGLKKGDIHDMWLMEEHKREFEEKTKERYKLANDVGLKALKLLASNLKDNPNLKEIRAAGNLAAKLIKRESAVELDTKPGKFTNLSAEEVGDLFNIKSKKRMCRNVKT